jgi:Ser/Thr protein kinase RdoA (MazF antagonist)
VLRRGAAGPTAGRRTGLLALNPDKQRLVLMGEPPHAGEKYYRSSADAAREADALGRMDRSPLVPRLLGRPTPHHVAFAWLPGQVLPVRRLAAAELVTWTERAASALAAVHAEVGGEPNFSHGDFWLGNVLVEGDRVTGVIDWTECRDGEPAADLAYLVESLIKVRPDLASRRVELVAAADRGFRDGAIRSSLRTETP